jgi:prolyl oligopeptidase
VIHDSVARHGTPGCASVAPMRTHPPPLHPLVAVGALALAACCTTPARRSVPDDSTERNMTKPDEPAPPTTTATPWPASRRDTTSDTLHGVVVADPYRWLEDERAAETQAWMTAQDDYARAELAKQPGRDALAKRLTEVFYYDAVSAPTHAGGRFFFTRKLASKEKNVVYWKQGEAGAEQVLFDPNTWSADGSSGLKGWWPSYDGKRVAYARSENNADESVTRVFDLATGKDLPDVVEGTKYADISWTPDGAGFYYTWVPPVDAVPVADRPGFAELRFHRLGDDPAKDAVVYPATKDAETFLGGYLSRDGHWLFATVQHGWNSSDWYVRDQRKAGAAFVPLVVGVPANFSVTAWRDVFYVHTNDGAPRYQIFKVDPKKPARADWKVLVAESDATLESMGIVGEHLVLTYLRNAASEVEVRSLAGKLVRKVPLPPLGTSGGISGNPDEDTGYFSYSSFTEPSVIYKTSIKTGAVSEWARVTLPIDTTQLVAEQVFYPSKDGTKISMFILHRKDVTRTGKTPTILYGYGGFNVSLTPSFASSRAVWLEQGGVYAIPNLRGGGEYGEGWHQDGMLLKKQNVFDDFIAAAEFLIADGWTSPANLAISGGSNGGLLVGAAMTQRPDLFGAVVCAVPLLDMIRYPQFGSGRTWVPEYGSPEDETQFKALYAYSPYHHVTVGTRYPALLMETSDHDDRVDPMHARKFVAEVQHARAADPSAKVLLRIERNAGHGGADMVKASVDRIADQYAFLLAQLGGAVAAK